MNRRAGRKLLALIPALVFASALAAAGAEPASVKVPANQRFVLPNGLTIVLVPKKDVPLIAFSGFVRGGAAADPADKAGVASMVAGLLDRGAGSRQRTRKYQRGNQRQQFPSGTAIHGLASSTPTVR